MKPLRWNIRQQSISFSPSDSKPQNGQLLVGAVLSARSDGNGENQAGLTENLKLFDPFLLADMPAAVEAVSTAVENGQLICIYGDYDCDGVCASVMVKSYFDAIGARSFFYIPDRAQGYGLNNAAIDEIKRLGADLILTVDNGISAIDEIAYANSLGLLVVVTDHHTPRTELPPAAAVVNPHRSDCGYPFADLCGAAVAFKLLCALEGDIGYELLEQFADLLAIATVADVVPLVSENRFFVKEGLRLIAESPRAGLQSLLEQSGVNARPISAESIAFGIAPRLNAAGRIDTADHAAMLLLAEDSDEAAELAALLESLNLRRRELEKQIADDILGLIEKDPHAVKKRVIVFAGENWHPGVVGIVCSRLVERFERPVILMSRENGVLKGSARSVAGFSIIEAITACGDLLSHYGGHPMAAGLTLDEANFAQFDAQLQAFCRQKSAMPAPELLVDCVVPPELISLEEAEGLAVLEPFGCKNDEPVFAVLGAVLERIIPLAQGKHTKLRLSKNGQSFMLLCFFTPPESLGFAQGDTVDAAFCLSVNTFQGERSVSARCVSIRPAWVDFEAVLHGRRLYEAFWRNEQNDAALLPTRDEVGLVYRQIKKSPLPFDSRDTAFYHISKAHPLCYERFSLAVDILLELGPLVVNDGILCANSLAGKVDLAASSIVRRLGNQ